MSRNTSAKAQKCSGTFILITVQPPRIGKKVFVYRFRVGRGRILTYSTGLAFLDREGSLVRPVAEYERIWTIPLDLLQQQREQGPPESVL